MNVPTLADVLEARKRIEPHLRRTPLHSYPALDELLGTRAWVKHENYQPTGAFKVRGGVNLIAQLSDDERKRGVIAASTGNHGQSVAYGARLFGVTARIVVPAGANPGKVAAMEGMGAEVIHHGERYDDARLYCEDLAAERGYRYVHSGNEPHLVAGVATYAVEMLEDEPGLDVVFVPIGGGSGAAAVCVGGKAIKPNLRVIGVQSEQAPAAYESWKARRICEAPNTTFAEGLATAIGFELPQRIIHERLDDFMLVSDDEIKQAMVWMIEKTHSLAEAAGASPLAGAYKVRETLAGLKVGLVCSGGNTSIEHLKLALANG
ncbi:MAG: threonine/serine dehydratase [Dehalococcoidia bacterium]